MSSLASKLSHYNGTENWHHLSPLHPFAVTDGVLAFAQEGKAFWAIDLIASWQIKPKVRAEYFQHWKILSKEGSFCATCDDGNGKRVALQKGFTNLEEGEYDFFLTDKVLLLTTEY